MADASFIPPGQEDLIGAMLGNGVALPGDCKLVSGNIQKTTVKATYTCASGEVIAELAHPAAAPADATRTEKLALRIERGTAPPELQSVLLSRIRERESQFRWIVYRADGPFGAELTGVPMLSGALLLGSLVLVALLLWRRRARPRPD
jgi:hypothetical protein